jgi:hypothetical protein
LEKQNRAGGPDRSKIDYLRTICGVFLDKKAVCEGYARAMQYLLQKSGIECAEAAGHTVVEDENTMSRKRDGGAHAWNILKIDGDYYYMDATWDDSSNTVQAVKSTELGFNYFCVTTDEMSHTREFDMCPVEMPECKALKANYYYHNNLVIDSYDLNKIKAIAINAAEKSGKYFTFKCKTLATYKDTLNRLCVEGDDCFDVLKAAAKVNKDIDPSSYTYNYDRNVYTIRVNLKQK